MRRRRDEVAESRVALVLPCRDLRPDVVSSSAQIESRGLLGQISSSQKPHAEVAVARKAKLVRGVQTTILAVQARGVP